MVDDDRDDADPKDYESVTPEARDYYQDSPPKEEGLLEKAREALGGMFGGGHHTATEQAGADDEGAHPVTGAGLTDYDTSNYSPDTGHPPSVADIDDVSRHEG